MFASGCRRRREGSGCSNVLDQHPLPASAEGKVRPQSGEGVSRRVLAVDQAGRTPESMQSQDSATAPLLLTAPPPSCVGHSCVLRIRYGRGPRCSRFFFNLRVFIKE